MDNDVALLAIHNMLSRSKEYNLEVECVWSLINSLYFNSDMPTNDQISQECANALCEWDL